MKLSQVEISKIIPKNLSQKKLRMTSLILLSFGLFMSFYGASKCMKVIVKYRSVLKPGRYVRSKHEGRIPFTYKLYLWNVTNPNDISTGTQKPKMQEIGPYVFS